MNSSGMFSISGAGAIQRIQRLLVPSAVRQPISPWLETVFLCSLVAVVLVGTYYHHGMETLAFWLTGG